MSLFFQSKRKKECCPKAPHELRSLPLILRNFLIPIEEATQDRVANVPMQKFWIYSISVYLGLVILFIFFEPTTLEKYFLIHSTLGI